MILGRDFLEKMLSDLKKQMEFDNKLLTESPEGKLYSIRRDGKPTYFQVISCGGKRKRISINKKKDQIAALARKEYLLEEKKLLEQNIRVIQRCLEGFSDMTAEQIFSRMPERTRELAKKWGMAEIEKSEQESRKWEAEAYEQSAFRLEEKIHMTSRGLRVRSKSELLIAEKLYEFEIPFRYEQVLKIGERILIPDFTIKKTEELPWQQEAEESFIYWEHCGLTGNMEYMRRHKEKIEIYEKAGIVPWKNLIVTYDDDRGNLNAAIIESEIKNRLL